MDVRPMGGVSKGLARYRITVPERPGRFAVLDIPADAEDPVGLVELFAGTHLHLLDWSHVAAEADLEATADVRADPGTEQPPPEHHVVGTG